MASTVVELSSLTASRPPTDQVFLNRCGQSITRFGIHTMVKRYIQNMLDTMPSLANKRVSPHTIRHTTATHLLRAGIDINTIRAWLGHVSINTTNVYAEVDLEMKAKGARNLRGPRSCSSKTLEGRCSTNAVLTKPLIENYVASAKRPCTLLANTASLRHIMSGIT